MTGIPTCVVDSSALMAFLDDERGAENVEPTLRKGAAISAVNMAEVLSKFSDRGREPDAALAALAAGGILPGFVTVIPLDAVGATESARLRASTKGSGLSLGDRACLALGRTLGVPVLTADRSWVGLRVGVKVVCVR